MSSAFSALRRQPFYDDVMKWLSGVPDPEIPVVSVVDLGIVRNVDWRDNTLIVTITPTYSGCPATSVIAMDIEAELVRRGIKNVRVETQLAPAWTTDWIGEEAKQKLRDYGIAPPAEGAPCVGALRPPAQIDCPHCGSSQTERVSEFGSTPCKASYRCLDCLEPFDYFKPF